MATTTKIYRASGGNELIVLSGGTITVNAGGVLDCSSATGSITFAAGEVTAVDLSSNSVITAKIEDDAVTSAKIDEGVIQTLSVALTNANIKALRGTPFQLVAAPGAGKVIDFISAVMILDYGTDALTESTDNMAIEYDSGSGSAVTGTIESTGFIDATADQIKTVIAAEIANDASADMVNKNLALANNGDGEFAGNATADTTMTIFVSYRILATGL